MIESYTYQAIKFAEKLSLIEKKGLSIDCIAAIHLYTMGWSDPNESFYYKINNVLRSSKRENIKIYFPLLRLLLFGLNKLDIYPKSIWRGIGKDLIKEYQYKKDDEIIWWSFSSCTNDSSVLNSSNFLGQNGNRTLFKIDNGHNGVIITQFSSFKNENEVLLLPGTIFKIGGILNVGNGLTIIDLNVVNDVPQMIDFPKSKT